MKKKPIIAGMLAGMLLMTPSIADAALGDVNLKQGMRHGDVKELQEVLRDTGHFNFHTSTGYFGSITRQAVREFQRDAGIRTDGIVGPQTFRALNAGSVETGGSRASTTIQSTLKRGSRGAEVRSLQEQLREKGYTNSRADGIFGSRTYTAVREFQRDAGIRADGIVGPQTMRALGQTTTRTANPSTPTPTPTPTQNNSVNEKIIQTGLNQVGTPYVWGGNTPSGFDCSGFIAYVYNQNGINIQRMATDGYWNSIKRVSNPQPGDIVFFQNTYRAGVSHMGIYVGDGTFIHAGSSRGVEATSLNNSYWKPRILGYGTFTR